MSNTFIYEQGWLVEKPDEHSENRKYVINNDEFIKSYEIFDKHLATLRRFKYDYPCEEGAELVEGKDFELDEDFTKGTGAPIIAIPLTPAPKMSKLEKEILDAMEEYAEQKQIAIPITQRTYSEQDLWLAYREGNRTSYVKDPAKTVLKDWFRDYFLPDLEKGKFKDEIK